MAIICPSCSSDNILELGSVSQINTFAGNTVEEPLPQSLLYKCNECHLCFKFPRPTTEKLNKLYEKGNLSHWQYELIHRDDWIVAFDWIYSTFNSGSILDIGCWDGQFLLNFDKTRFQLFGVEINPKAREKAESKGIKIICNNIYELNSVSICCEIITAFDVIEHLDEPLKFLEIISNLTKKNGLIIIASGNTNATTWKIMKNKYWYCSIPEHISFINTDWCKYAAKKCNLELLHIHKFSHSNKTNLFFKFVEICKNAFYLLFPQTSGFFRKMINPIPRSRKSSYPPIWMSSKDHIIAIFKKI
jgi:2-polyprenyl-3-methyl-5-hydroxy-6-metoxy-1,4-benzoquinol methylase